ncbi:MAG: ribbon-helix-helix protein, CopG family [Acidimicrobiales bacterium]
MRRTTVMLPDELDARLRLEARRQGVSIADVARQAIDRSLPPLPTGGPLGFFSVGDGGPPDVSERVDDYVARAIERHRETPELRREQPRSGSC